MNPPTTLMPCQLGDSAVELARGILLATEFPISEMISTYTFRECWTVLPADLAPFVRVQIPSGTIWSLTPRPPEPEEPAECAAQVLSAVASYASRHPDTIAIITSPLPFSYSRVLAENEGVAHSPDSLSFIMDPVEDDDTFFDLVDHSALQWAGGALLAQVEDGIIAREQLQSGGLIHVLRAEAFVCQLFDREGFMLFVDPDSDEWHELLLGR